MPITTRIPLRRLNQSEFGDIAYEVMRHVFAIHNELGRFFDEKIYKAELAQRMSDGGSQQVEVDVPVAIDNHQLGQQRMRVIAPGVAFKITGLDHSLDDFETHARRLLEHVDLQAIAWVNINMKQVTFTTLTKWAEKWRAER